ncbi:DinB family protein [Deinococcus misasensis]|uniref:DinB family protein n=1 Tax=Deinococcus misasensis TaxID=392413 RepID=UPI0005572883|nr:DinB family protein [Deinococcus misasensis]
MNPEMFYTYLTKARRLLWDSLRSLSDEELSRATLPGDGPRCLKDLVFHVAIVEDAWFRQDMLKQTPVYDALGPEIRSADQYWHHEHQPLEELLSYWEAVESDTLQRWPELMSLADTETRIKTFDDRPETMSAEEVLWHVMQHEVRHTAQMVQMIRLLGHQPPSLDYAFLMAR